MSGTCCPPRQLRAALQDNLEKERDNQATPGPQQLSLPGSTGPRRPRPQCQSSPLTKGPTGVALKPAGDARLGTPGRSVPFLPPVRWGGTMFRASLP